MGSDETAETPKAALPTEQLQSLIRGALHTSDSPSFSNYVSAFNGSVQSPARLVACPLDAQDVSQIVQWTKKHNLKLSVKSGGYAIAGWSVQGDVIIDTGKMDNVGIHVQKGKLKDFSTPPPDPKGKRRREDDIGILGGEYEVPATKKFRVYSHAEMSQFGAPSSSRPALRFTPQSSDSTPFPYLATTPKYSHVYVSTGAGSHQSAIDAYCAEHPVEGIPYHIPSAAHPVGATTLVTGGFGFLSRLYGLSIDNIVEVELVLQDGSIVYASEEEHADLFWALRGAGPAFGICTRYLAKAYPVPLVYSGSLIYRFNPITAPSLVKHFRDVVKSSSTNLSYANILLTAGPAGKDSLIVIQLCFVGSKQEGGREWLDTMMSWETAPGGEKSLLCDFGEKTFEAQQGSVKQILRGRAGRQWYIRSCLISALPDALVHETVSRFADSPVGCTWLFELAGGAVVTEGASAPSSTSGDSTTPDSIVTLSSPSVSPPPPSSEQRAPSITSVLDSVPSSRTPFPTSLRTAQWNLVALHQWDLGDDDDRCVDAGEEWIARLRSRGANGDEEGGMQGVLPGFISPNDPPEVVRGSFGEHWERLEGLKKKWDPENTFHSNFWPSSTENEHPRETETDEPSS